MARHDDNEHAQGKREQERVVGPREERRFEQVVARLRRSKRASVIGIIVAFALLGSAWLAYATNAPNGPYSYPVTAIQIRGEGFVGNKLSVNGHLQARGETKFGFDVIRKATGAIRGSLNVTCGSPTLPRPIFHSSSVDSLLVTGHTATFEATGHMDGKQNKGKVFNAEVTATDGSPDTVSITIHNGPDVVCQASGPVVQGRVWFRDLNG